MDGLEQLRSESRSAGSTSAAGAGAPDARGDDRLIFGLCAGKGAQAWYRVQQPLRTLNEMGYSCAWSNRLPKELWPGDVGLPELRDRTTIIGQFVGTPEGSQRWREMAKEGQRVFYEMDDDIFSIDPSNPAHHELTAPGLFDRVSENLRVATGVIVTRRPLAQVVRQHTDAPIYVIPNYIPEWLLTHKKPDHPLRTSNNIVVGWSGSSNHVMDWQHYAPRLIQWINRTPSAILHIMGEPTYVAVHRRDLPDGRVVAERWYDTVEEYFRAIKFDIAVIPLRNREHNRKVCKRNNRQRQSGFCPECI